MPKKMTPMQLGASLMSKKRWKKMTKTARSEFMSAASLKVKNRYKGGRPRSTERCYCGMRSLHSATLRAFDCCKKAGVFPGQEQKSA